MAKKLFVGGLAWATTDDGLRQAFERFGQVAEAKVIMDRETGRSRGFGFVSFNDDGQGSARWARWTAGNSTAGPSRSTRRRSALRVRVEAVVVSAAAVVAAVAVADTAIVNPDSVRDTPRRRGTTI